MQLHVSTRKGLFQLEDRGAGWEIARVSFLGDPVTGTVFDPSSGALYAALSLGHFGAKLRRSDDGGETWRELPCPAFPAPPEGTDPKDAPTVKTLWTLETGGAGRPGRLWAGCAQPGLFRSDDGGESWRLVTSLWDRPERKEWFGGGFDVAGIHSISVDPRDPDRVALGISCGGVWRTEDAGETWTLGGKGMTADYMPPERADEPNIQDPHRLVRSPSSPDVFWVQHHCGVFRSVDGADSWQPIPAAAPSAFGFAVAVHPRDPDTAWFVPAVKDEKRIPVDGAVVVSRTRDGGRSFEVLREGLPQRHAYDLVFRHALDVDPTGDQLAFGSTTGSLWTSDDQGDSWRTVSEHLPPIYAVRFSPSRTAS